MLPSGNERDFHCGCGQLTGCHTRSNANREEQNDHGDPDSSCSSAEHPPGKSNGVELRETRSDVKEDAAILLPGCKGQRLNGRSGPSEK